MLEDRKKAEICNIWEVKFLVWKGDEEEEKKDMQMFEYWIFGKERNLVWDKRGGPIAIILTFWVDPFNCNYS